MKKKKLLAGILSVATAVSMLAGCGTQTQTEDKKGSESTESDSKGDTAAEKPVLTWYVGNGAPEDNEEVVAAINEKLDGKLDATVDIIWVNGDLEEQVQMMASTGEEFDICFVASWCGPYADLARNGALLDVTDLMEENCPGILETVPSSVLDGVKVDGKQYAIPNYQPSVEDKHVGVLKEYADKYDFDMSTIHSVADLEPYLQIIKENEPALVPISSTGFFSYEWQTLMEDEYECLIGFQVYCNKEIGVIEVNFDKEKEAAAFLADWYQKGYIREDCQTALEYSSDVANGKYAFIYNADGKPGFESIYAEEYEWARVAKEPYARVDAYTAACNAISATSKHPELALQFLDLVNTDKEIYNLLCYGIEGKHYDFNDDGTITLSEENLGYRPNCDWRFGCQFNAYVVEGNPSNIWDLSKEYQDNAKPSPILGVTLDKSPVETEMVRVTDVREQYASLFFGNCPAEKFEETWAAYVADMKEAGIQTICDEFNNQVKEQLGK